MHLAHSDALVTADSGLPVPLRMHQIAFVAGRNDRGGAITMADIGQRHQDVDLADRPTAVVPAEQPGEPDIVAAGMNRNESAGPANVQETFVDTQLVGADRDIPADLVEPFRIVDQFLEYRAALDDVLEIDAVLRAVRMDLDVADPVAGLQRVDVVAVHPAVDRGELVRVERAADDAKSVEVE